MSMKRTSGVALPGCLLGSALLCGAAAEAADGKRVLRVAMSSDIRSTEYATKHDMNTQMVLSQVLEGLVAYKDDLTVAPLLAESYQVSDEGKTYTFRLREGLKFHNGKPVTAAAVKWTWERYLDPAVNWGAQDHCREIFDGAYEAYSRPVTILGVETPDEKTVVFRLQSRSAVFLHWMSSNYCLAGILERESVNADGTWNRPVGTGPFMLKEWRKGQYVELQRFADYNPRAEARSGWTGAKLAGVDSVRFAVAPEPAKTRAALAAGEIDVWADVPKAERAGLKGLSGLTLHTHPTPAWHLLLIQTRSDPLLRDKRIRQAISYAIDRERVVREGMQGIGVVNASVVARVSPFYTKAHAVTLGYDPKRARALLEEAGYDGRPLKIHASRDVYPFFYDAALPVRDMLREAGFNAEVEEMSWQAQSSRYGANDFQLASMTYSMRTDPALMYSAIVGQKTDHKWYLWEDMEADLLVAQSVFAKTDAERQALFDRLHARMLDHSPLVGLFNTVRVDATRASVKGYAPWALAIPRFWGVTLE
jgi:peptide/nickel transport system substrate-binding protein